MLIFLHKIKARYGINGSGGLRDGQERGLIGLHLRIAETAMHKLAVYLCLGV